MKMIEGAIREKRRLKSVFILSKTELKEEVQTGFNDFISQLTKICNYSFFTLSFLLYLYDYLNVLFVHNTIIKY